ncbi:iron ABC transporter permease [Scrofimicrobium sp. R131]|uniref:Iron ABC transporter permease n=1 Tax=Scrofimicrobium appendicitidis TaxID=3079930 RepID=A0AAU7VAB5_9ACTO
MRRRAIWWTVGLFCALLVTIVLAIGIGPVFITAPQSLSIIWQNLFHSPVPFLDAQWSEANEAIIWSVRVPRVLLGCAVGAGLSLVGTALQAIVRNMLADPYILGISGGASTGAAAAILFGVGSFFGQQALPASAFIGAMAASLLVFFIAKSGGAVTSLRLLLAGVAVGYALSATTSFLIFMSDSAEGSRSVMFWLLGSLALARWDLVLAIVIVVVALTVVFLLTWSRRLDALAAGDTTALTLGISPNRTRIEMLVVVSLCTGAVVAASGAIGFVGLVVPHFARRLVGATHRRLLPVAAILGALLLVWADVAARTLLQPRELPIGIITSLIGAPFLLILVKRMYPQEV